MKLFFLQKQWIYEKLRIYEPKFLTLKPRSWHG